MHALHYYPYQLTHRVCATTAGWVFLFVPPLLAGYFCDNLERFTTVNTTHHYYFYTTKIIRAEWGLAKHKINLTKKFRASSPRTPLEKPGGIFFKPLRKKTKNCSLCCVCIKFNCHTTATNYRCHLSETTAKENSMGGGEGSNLFTHVA